MHARRESHPGLKRSSLGLKGAIVTLSVGVLVPVILSTTVGIVALVIGTSTKELLIGVLVVCFTAAAAGSAVVSVVLLGRRARLARLQSDLLANVSHELRTPLAAIRMYAQTLESGLLEKDPQTTRQSLATIVRETEWLEATVERVLTWRSLARDQDAVDLRPGPVKDAVEDAVARFRRMVVPGEVELGVEIGSARPLNHDRDALGRVVLNLLVNAWKYTGEGKRIRVAVRDEGDDVEIAVEDNGIGIPARELEHVFEPFYRVESGAPGGPAGAGLGLAIVRQVVRLHGGEVTVASEPGRGSVFTVRLPAAPEGGEA
jgi:two-component system, OmpR family, phosphate regulon sensor histidine kinase PhoR